MHEGGLSGGFKSIGWDYGECMRVKYVHGADKKNTGFIEFGMKNSLDKVSFNKNKKTME